MSDFMREEFEQAVVNMHVSHGVTPEDATAFLETGSNGYSSVGTKSAWWAWKASRECLVIELPIIQECCSDGGESSKWMAPEDVIKSIHAAGVKYK